MLDYVEKKERLIKQAVTLRLLKDKFRELTQEGRENDPEEERMALEAIQKFEELFETEWLQYRAIYPDHYGEMAMAVTRMVLKMVGLPTDELDEPTVKEPPPTPPKVEQKSQLDSLLQELGVSTPASTETRGRKKRR